MQYSEFSFLAVVKRVELRSESFAARRDVNGARGGVGSCEGGFVEGMKAGLPEAVASMLLALIVIAFVRCVFC